MQPSANDWYVPVRQRFLELAVFRFEDVCVRVQDGMGAYLRTAALEKKPGVEATFRWLRRRGVRVCLLTDYGREELSVLLGRLGWGIGEEELIQLAVVEQQQKPNAVRVALKASGLVSASQAIVVVDTPQLLKCAIVAGAHLVFGVTNGSSSYQDLALEPFRALLDSALQLPNYLLQQLPAGEIPSAVGQLPGPPRLWYAG